MGVSGTIAKSGSGRVMGLPTSSGTLDAHFEARRSRDRRAQPHEHSQWVRVGRVLRAHLDEHPVQQFDARVLLEDSSLDHGEAIGDGERMDGKGWVCTRIAMSVMLRLACTRRS